MKTTYRREMKHNYLIIEPEDAGYDGYEIYMMEKNRIEGLLGFQMKQIDGRRYYYYEITSKQPLNRVLEYHSLGEGELKKLINKTAQTLDRMEAYLLHEKQILLEPEYIYVNPETFEIYLCLIPGRQGGFPEEMSGLLRYLLGKVNHQDKECVVTAYGLYQESLKENYGIRDLMEIVGRNGGQKEKQEEEKETLRDSRKISETPELRAPYFSMEETGREDSLHKKKKENLWEPGLWTAAAAALAAAAGTAAVLWLIFGMEGILKFWYGSLGAGVLTASAVLLKARKEPQTSKEERTVMKDLGLRQEREEYDWRMTFEEESKEKDKEPKQEEVRRETALQTVLLTDRTEDESIRYLRATAPDMEDIGISYIPYLIGKQEGLVDYVLSSETISRIHARIDREGEEYRISDLNSTNGTCVNGRLLETNETVVLKKGDEVLIADFAFIFT
ncbi:MAG: DUF6382 domain-containing protein [Lacrimispora sp.]|uniref:DUF6382 domain-containing protein n=1 Tax=Lacrimispora sp. TaxID=2719234 RepID=UPI0039E34637